MSEELQREAARDTLTALSIARGTAPQLARDRAERLVEQVRNLKPARPAAPRNCPLHDAIFNRKGN